MPLPAASLNSIRYGVVGPLAPAAAAAFRSEASFNSRDSFSTRCRMIFPGLNFTVAREGITKLLPGSLGLRPMRGFVKRG